MQSRITGTTMPVLEITLAAGERLTAEGGDVAWLTSGFSLETSTRFGSGGRGGFMSGLKRALGGGGLFLTEYTPPRSGGFVAFAAQLPGTIREITVDPSAPVMVISGSFVASTSDIEVSVGLQKKIGAGLFGGAGVVFQKLAGHGTAWVQLAGEITEYDLPAGQSLWIHPGHLALLPADLRVEFASIRGVRNKLFGDSLVMAEVHGPGRIWLQSMTPAKLAAAIQPFLPDRTSSSSDD
jgi:uncharacterized protein (TIGR00266 family)